VSATQKLFRFGGFELNLESEELSKSGIPVKLPPQPLKLLALLAGHASQVVTRDQIQKELWAGETFVDFDHGVNKCINQIRTVLGDNADRPLYIETLPRRGYRFVAPVISKTISAPQPRIIESESGERSRLLVLIGGRMQGSAATAEVAASEPAVAPNARPAAESLTAAEPAQKARSRWSQARLAWIGAAVLLVAVVGAGLYWRWRAHKTPVLTEKDTIVLADFDNKTRDPVFDDTLKQGLAIQLEQSPFLNLISQAKVIRTLKLMERPAGDLLTPEVAREVCQRTGSKAMLTGSIDQLGSQYVLGLKAVNCNTGDVLAEVQEQATGKEAVLKALDAAVIGLRSKLGESLSSVQRYTTPLAEATTPSLEALQAYSQGRKMQSTKGDTAALPFFKRALELDPNFAMAYSGMSDVSADLGEVERAQENARKAYELRGKVSERERFGIEANYYSYVTVDPEKAAQVYELWQQSYPRDALPYQNLVFIYGNRGNLEKALEEARAAIRLEPNDVNNYMGLALAYMCLNRLDEAETVFQQAEERKLESEGLISDRYVLAFLRGDTAQMARLAAAALGKPGTEDLMLATQAETEGYYGRLKNARELIRRAMDSAQHNDAKETAAVYQSYLAGLEVELGYPRQARADADAALKLAPNFAVQVYVARVLAQAGDIARAEQLAAELDKTLPLSAILQRDGLSLIRAAVALDRKDPQRALELLKSASTINYPANYFRGKDYLMLHDGNAAAAEYQKIIDHYGLVGNDWMGALARLGLARAYVLDAAKDPAARDKARTAYQNFLTLWKDADPDIPVYKQAKAEYQHLR
jgi:DNA-binding winged helix-turn-helix (wHTH) protein/tetratricopeptide (TPR) repeat protein